MRKLSEEFKNKFKNEFKFIIDFVKENKDDVFLGIRDDSINLYANGGSFLQISKSKDKYIAYFNSGEETEQKGYYSKLNKKTIEILKDINNKEITLENFNTWNSILTDLKNAVKSYMECHKRGRGTGASKEKILQQKLALAFNNHDNPYFTYDIEYNIESLNDYYYKADGTPDKKRSPHTLGRMDNMTISITKDNKINLYLMELKEGVNAIEATNFNSKSKNEKYDSFKNGVIGHINLYMTIINQIKKDTPYVSMYRKDNSFEPFTFDIKNQLLEEIKGTMKFYKEFGLINNNEFLNIEPDKLVFGDVELVFYLGGYTNSKKFETHLGIIGNNNDSVINLINNNPMAYKYISSDEIYDFKFYKDSKLYNEERTKNDLEIHNYETVEVVKEQNKVSFKISNKHER